MDPALSDPSSLKRKRTPNPAEDGRKSAAGMAPANVTQINYLMRAKSERLRLIEGDSETFADVLGMLDDYEGVLQRHESLAANLGAKLVGPLLLKSFEKLFDSPIKVVTSSFGLEQSPVSWLDVVTFARANPSEFVLTEAMSETTPGMMCCRFWIKGGQIEISEDDYRLIMSGAPERMIPTQPISEDETAELGTLNILENRLAILIKKADAVASKARQLNYHLKGRKTAVLSRKSDLLGAVEGERNFSPQPYSAVNSRSSNLSPTGETAKVQAQLLEQYMSLDRRAPTHPPRPVATRMTTAEPASFPVYTQEGDTRRMSHPINSSEEGTQGQYRLLMASKIEKLAKGDPVFPPCDRCRRLNFECTKHLTACQACTKKHAKCSWKDIREGELDFVPRLPTPGHGTQSGAENGAAGNGNVDPSLRNEVSVQHRPANSRGTPAEDDEMMRALMVAYAPPKPGGA